MADFNPYQAPSAHVDDVNDSEEFELAGRWIRLGASILDFIVLAIFLLLPFYLLGLMNLLENPITGLVLGQIAFLIFNGYLLFAHGQTIGKKLLSIKITLVDGEHPRFGRSYALRYLFPNAIFQMHPFLTILALVDVLFIFGNSRRCVHDLIAGTIVVKA